MSLTASMWTSVSGLLNHGEKMNVVGNNIANTNTVAFKGSRMDFSDYVHSTVFTNSGPTQVGRGVSIGAIYGDFGQGAFESSTESTDMAISGNGFFKVVAQNSGQEYFTRAGNFRFNNEGYLVDPNSHVLQGWAIEQAAPSYASGTSTGTNKGTVIKGTGVPVDVRLASFSCEPHHTSSVTIATNLDSAMGAEKTAASTPNEQFYAMWSKWDATPAAGTGEIPPPLGNDGFAYQQSITVYDEGGGAHTLTIYYDKAGDTTTEDPSKAVWEFIVTMDPSEDVRTFWDGTNHVPVPDDKKGLLMTGTITFNSSGLMTDMMAYVPTIGGSEAAGPPVVPGFDSPSTWVAAPISSNGYPMFAANFSGQYESSNVWATNPTIAAPGTENPNVIGRLTELNLGFKNKNDWWDYTGTTAASADMGQLNNSVTELPGMGTSGERQNPATTAYKGNGSNFYERYAKQDGYTYGELSSIHITQDGILTGRYSNGVTLELFQITLYDFNAKHELYREGGNLFSQTRESGDPTQGAAGSGSFGSILGNNLEQSNVDIAREFVQMITTQRGFQSNSKLITTTDTMLENVINMKR